MDIFEHYQGYGIDLVALGEVDKTIIYYAARNVVKLYIKKNPNTVNLKAETNNINKTYNNFIHRAKINTPYKKNTWTDNNNTPSPSSDKRIY